MKQKLYPWLVMLCCCGQAAVFLGFTNNCSGVFFAPIAAELQIGLGEVSLYLTIINLLSGFLGPAAVKLYQNRHPKCLFLFAAAGTAIGYFGMACVKSVKVMYLFAALIGISSALYNMAIISLFIGRWFHEKMGFVMGFTLSFSGLIAAAMNPIFNRMIEQIGWRQTYMLVSIPVFLILLPSALFLRMRPEELGLFAYGDVKKGQKTSEYEKRNGRKQKEDVGIQSKKSRRKITVLACVIGFSVSFITGLASHAPNHAVTIGLGSHIGAFMVSALMVGNTTSKLVAGIFCDMIGEKKTCAAALSIVATGILLLVFVTDKVPLLLAASVMTGVVYCIAGVVLSTLIKGICGLEMAGLVYAKVSMVGCIGSAVSFTIIGASFDLFGSYVPSILICLLLDLLSIGALYRIHVLVRKEEGLR